jgi:hypothetical protein
VYFITRTCLVGVHLTSLELAVSVLSCWNRLCFYRVGTCLSTIDVCVAVWVCRVFWSSVEEPRFALREWQRARTAAAAAAATPAAVAAAALEEQGRSSSTGGAGVAGGAGGGRGRGRLTQHATLDQLCSLTRDGEVGALILDPF